MKVCAGTMAAPQTVDVDDIHDDGAASAFARNRKGSNAPQHEMICVHCSNSALELVTHPQLTACSARMPCNDSESRDINECLPAHNSLVGVQKCWVQRPGNLQKALSIPRDKHQRKEGSRLVGDRPGRACIKGNGRSFQKRTSTCCDEMRRHRTKLERSQLLCTSRTNAGSHAPRPALHLYLIFEDF